MSIRDLKHVEGKVIKLERLLETVTDWDIKSQNSQFLEIRRLRGTLVSNDVEWVVEMSEEKERDDMGFCISEKYRVTVTKKGSDSPDVEFFGLELKGLLGYDPIKEIFERTLARRKDYLFSKMGRMIANSVLLN